MLARRTNLIQTEMKGG